MKLITATIRPFRLDDVRQALKELGRVTTVSEVKTYNPRKASSGAYLGGEHAGGFVPKVKIEIYVPDVQTAKTIEIIRKAALTGHLGDGIISVTTVDQLVRIRTGELDEAAL